MPALRDGLQLLAHSSAARFKNNPERLLGGHQLPSHGEGPKGPGDPQCVLPPLGKGGQASSTQGLVSIYLSISAPQSPASKPHGCPSNLPSSSHSLLSAGPVRSWRPARRLPSPDPDGLQVLSWAIVVQEIGPLPGPGGNHAASKEQQLALFWENTWGRGRGSWGGGGGCRNFLPSQVWGRAGASRETLADLVPPGRCSGQWVEETWHQPGAGVGLCVCPVSSLVDLGETSGPKHQGIGPRGT